MYLPPHVEYPKQSIRSLTQSIPSFFYTFEFFRNDNLFPGDVDQFSSKGRLIMRTSCVNVNNRLYRQSSKKRSNMVLDDIIPCRCPHVSQNPKPALKMDHG